MKTAVLRINCRDVKGVVFNVSRFIYERGGNIITAQQHCEELDQRFFMRVHFDMSDFQLTRAELADQLQKELAEPFEMEAALTYPDVPRRMALMVSKYDHCLYDLLLRKQYGELNCEIGLIVSNHTDLEDVARQFRVPFFYMPVNKSNKAEAEKKTLELFRSHQVDFIVLARYMQILSPLLVEAYPNKIINVHHGFLPAFKGARPYHQAYERGVKLIGATSHYVTEELDNGPIIAQETIPVTHSHAATDMLALGRDVEKQVLARAVRAHAHDLIMVYKNRTIVFEG